MEPSIYVRAAKIIGVTGAAWLGGEYTPRSQHYISRQGVLQDLKLEKNSMLTGVGKGNIAALSLLATPGLRRSNANDGVPSSIISKQWRYIYDSGKSQNPPIAAITAAAYLYLAWSAHRVAPLGQLPLCYGSAAMLTLGIVPFTLIAMSSTNNKLIQHSNAVPKSPSTPLQQPSDEEVDSLIAQWTTLNLIRSLLPLAGSILGAVAMLA
ncbi:uncharacterized protein Z520_09424 [Fonsecaea multimorphosa CBS 102226]|uniref:DUF1772-domain-containing protein n=1 Tax=Fonsecaea multimorphosa CBS 102226 TaxID=1442371 RepID=A0A0D2JW49_9EURO|nr:uncharacterized protein Z520_09424 [Fonsecaea multimorphosa CBS 102226]KIX94734.1 hypothetical protein Z520_09424 [Fonsecaea multimorphosa CBS 102226]OAL20508.1 hypothetical protein AYO22_08809 [Fonsecaea multimorphosa]